MFQNKSRVDNDSLVYSVLVHKFGNSFILAEPHVTDGKFSVKMQQSQTA